MKRNRSIELFTAVVGTSLLLGVSASAQISEARLKEIMNQVIARQAQAPLTFSAQAPTGNGPTVPLTLDDAVKFALANNLDIAVQRMNPELQDIAVAAAQTVYHPMLTSSISRSSTTTTPTNQLNLSSSGAANISHNLGYNATISQSLPWNGASLRANLQNSRADSNSNNSTFNPSYQSTWTATFTQPLLRGRAIDANRRQIVVTKINRDISDVQLQAALTNLVSNVKNAYWDFVYTTQAVESAQQSLDLADKLVQDNTTKVEVGTMAPIDITSAQAEQASRRLALVQAQNSRRNSEISLKKFIVGGTDDPNWTATLNPIDRPEFQPETVDLQAAISRALAERTDLAIVKKNVDLNNLSLKNLRDQTLPTVDLQVDYGLNGVGGTQLVRSNSGVLGSAVSTTIPGGIADAFSTLFRGRNPRWTISANISYPIGMNTADTSLARAHVQLNQIQAQLKNIELQVSSDLTAAAINLTNTQQSVQAAQASREYSQRRLEAEQSKFDVGMSTNYQVVQAQRDFNDARNSELRAVLNYRKAQVEFDRLQQTALQNSNITVIQ